VSDDDWVLGVTVDGEPKAYPLRILNWHEIVNDRSSNGTRFAVTHCPLVATGVAFALEAVDSTGAR